MTIPVIVFVALFGLAIGSFLNVCIYRMPRGESVAWPPSHCPSCDKPIAAYDNIPVLSYLILGGRCRRCKAAISFVYPLVEASTAVVFLLSYLQWGLGLYALRAATLGAALIALTITDVKARVLPDKINFPLMGIGLVYALLVPVDDGTAEWLVGRVLGLSLPDAAVSVVDGVLGALVGGGILFALGEIWYRVKGVEAMGFGDVKMMAMVGLFFGVKLTVLTLLLGSVGGSLIGGVFILASGKDAQYELPFGTFLGGAGLFSLFWGERLVRTYLGLFQ